MNTPKPVNQAAAAMRSATAAQGAAGAARRGAGTPGAAAGAVGGIDFTKALAAQKAQQRARLKEIESQNTLPYRLLVRRTAPAPRATGNGWAFLCGASCDC